MRYIGRKEQKWAGAKQRLLQDMSHRCKGGGVQRAKATEGRVAAYNLGTWSSSGLCSKHGQLARRMGVPLAAGEGGRIKDLQGRLLGCRGASFVGLLSFGMFGAWVLRLLLSPLVSMWGSGRCFPGVMRSQSASRHPLGGEGREGCV